MDLNSLLLGHFQASDYSESPHRERYLPHLPSLASEVLTQDIQVPTVSPEKEIVRDNGGFSTPKPSRISASPRPSPLKSSSNRVLNIFPAESHDTEDQDFENFRNMLMQPYADPLATLQKENIVPTGNIQGAVAIPNQSPSIAQNSLEVFFDKLHLRLHKVLHEQLTSRNLLQSELGDFIRLRKQGVSQELGEQIDALEDYMAGFDLSLENLHQTANLSAKSLTKPYRTFGNKFMQEVRRLRMNAIDRLEHRMYGLVEENLKAAVHRTEARISRNTPIVFGDRLDGSDTPEIAETEAKWVRDWQTALEKVTKKINSL